MNNKTTFYVLSKFAISSFNSGYRDLILDDLLELARHNREDVRIIDNDPILVKAILAKEPQFKYQYQVSIEDKT